MKTPLDNDLKEMYEGYKDSVEMNSPYDVTHQEFMQILDEYYKSIIEGLLVGKGGYKLPFNLGRIDITKSKIDLANLKRIDWKASVELGKRIYHLNEHSDGYDYTIEWVRINANARNSKLYVYSPTRYMKRTLAKLIKNKEFDTYEF